MTIAFLVLITCPNDSILLLYFFFSQGNSRKNVNEDGDENIPFRHANAFSPFTKFIMYVLKVEVEILKMQSTC